MHMGSKNSESVRRLNPFGCRLASGFSMQKPIRDFAPFASVPCIIPCILLPLPPHHSNYTPSHS